MIDFDLMGWMLDEEVRPVAPPDIDISDIPFDELGEAHIRRAATEAREEVDDPRGFLNDQ
jgi:hypothetical protein